jgi:hypothetical protein
MVDYTEDDTDFSEHFYVAHFGRINSVRSYYPTPPILANGKS